mmetsp:Transcript_13491/g.32007  ORF Transcript_13491/g.32007 Transcript_13491/m.32007 type:complete len:200 (+) Transcript_13491:334-933(+)
MSLQSQRRSTALIRTTRSLHQKRIPVRTKHLRLAIRTTRRLERLGWRRSLHALHASVHVSTMEVRPTMLSVHLYVQQRTWPTMMGPLCHFRTIRLLVPQACAVSVWNRFESARRCRGVAIRNVCTATTGDASRNGSSSTTSALFAEPTICLTIGSTISYPLESHYYSGRYMYDDRRPSALVRCRWKMKRRTNERNVCFV